MKKITFIFAFFVTTLFAKAQTADLQVIHNCADPAADSVDVYVNGSLALNNFAFRNATGFLPLPAGIPLQIGIAAKNSTSVADTLVNFNFILDNGGRYVAIASGVLNPANFASNPDGRSTGFSLLVKDNITNGSGSASSVDLYVAHGSTDAPTVDVIQQAGGIPLVNDAAFGDITNALTVANTSYTLNITPGNNNSSVVASYRADLTTLGGGTAVVFASGFLTPASNQNGASFGVFAALSNGTVIELPASTESLIQIIHNSADPAAASVDVYVNGLLTLDNFVFRSATSFISVPANTTLNIGVAASSSSSVSDTLVNVPITLQNGQTYIAVANGVLNPGSFAVNPDGRSTSFNLQLKSGVRIEGSDVLNADLIVMHGSTDAPTVDVIPQSSSSPIIDNASYGDVTNYLSLPADEYILNITPGNDNSTIVRSYVADLNLISGSTAFVFASGFLNTAANQNGESFGLFAALPSGTVIPLPAATTSRLQVIHNCADPAASSVDIYVNGSLFRDNFNFREATPFSDVPSGVLLNIGIAPGSSSSVSDTLVNIPVTLDAGQSYVAVASGVLNPASFASNPEGRNTGFQLLLRNAILESSATPSNTDFVVLHGSTDAPGIDVIVRNSSTIVDNAKYTDFTNYISVPSTNYILDITPENNNSLVLASYRADLTSLAGASAIIFASGFLDPSANQNGLPIGLFAALTDGTVIPLPNAADARLQVIHNCADPGAASVDIYVNDSLLLDNFNYLEATPFINVPSNTTLNIGIAPGSSTSVTDTLVNIPVSLDAGVSYLAVASGVLNPASFAPNPDGRNTGFQLLLRSDMRESSPSSSTTEVLVLHGCTDAPGVDVLARGVATVVDNAKYTDFSNYITVPNVSYILDITPEADNTNILASYTADLTPLGGGSAVVFASGFFNPAINQNGQAFGLYAALTNGTVFPLTNITAIDEANLISGSIYPNPATSTIFIPLRDVNTTTTVRLSDISGRIVSVQEFTGGQKMIQVNVSGVEPGMYTCSVMVNGNVATSRIMVTK